MLFNGLIPHQKLYQLEKKETEKYNKAWALWYQFSHHPQKYWKDTPDIRASAIITLLKNDLLNSIKSLLNNISHDDLTVSIINECFEYQGTNALLIQVEIQGLEDMENAFINTVEALTKAVRPVNFTDLKYFVLSDLWDNFVIVPTNNGHAISNSAWVILAASFVGDNPVINEDKPYLYLPRPLAAKELIHLGIKKKETGQAKILEDLEREIGSIFAIINHMHCFEVLVPNVNKTGIEVLESYLSFLLEPLTQNIKMAGNLIEKTRENISEDDIALLVVLDECEQAIQPYEESENNKIEINLSDCRVWAELLVEALGQLQTLKMNMAAPV